MRVSTSEFQNASTNTILDQQSQLLKTQNQLGTGRRILTPADDPSGAARALDVDKAVKNTEQYQRNNEQAELRLRQEDSVLDEVTNVVNRVRELTVQASNGSQTESSRQSIAAELRERREELQDLANTQDGRGEYLFSGLKTKTEPFVRQDGQVQYQGDQGQRSIQVGPNRQIDSSHNGFETFVKIPTGNGDFSVASSEDNNGSARLAGERVIDADQAFRGPYEIQFEEHPVTGDIEQRVVAGDFVDEDGDPLPTDAMTDGVAEGLNTGDAPWTGEITVQAGGESDTLELDGSEGIQNVGDLAGAIEDWLENDSGLTLAGDLQVSEDAATGELRFDYDGDDPVRVGVALEDDNEEPLEDDLALGSLIETQTYEPGEAIEFDGRSITFEGNPQAGDRFEVEGAGNQSIFDTVDDVIESLETRGDTSADRARLATESYQALENFDAAIDSFSQTRAEAGARLNALESEYNANETAKLDLQTELSRIEDLNYAEAISRLNQESVGLEAAQRSYAQIQNLSLFDYI